MPIPFTTPTGDLMTDQAETEQDVTYDVTATISTTSRAAAVNARRTLAAAIAPIAERKAITRAAVELVAEIPGGPTDLGPYGQALATAVADELDRREQAACDQAAAEFDAVWDSVGGRPVEVAGSPENLAALDRLLTGWRCCTAPASCGARCQDDELSDVLARAARLVAAALAAPAPAASEEPTSE